MDDITPQKRARRIHDWFVCETCPPDQETETDTSCRTDERCVSNAIKNIERRKAMLIYKERYKKPYVPIEIAEIQRLLKIDGAEIRCREQGVTGNGQGRKVEYLLVLSVPRKKE